MPVTLSYPGVYIEELPSGVRTITGVATSITAFVGSAPMGPAEEPVIINNFGDYERTFGKLHPNYPLGYSVRDFYLNGGAKAVIVRLYKKKAGNNVNANASIKLTNLPLEAASPGSWGNTLRARVDYNVSADVAARYGLAAADLFNLTVRDTATGITETFLNLTVKESPRRADRVLASESSLLHVASSATMPGTTLPPKHGDVTPGKDIWKEDTLSTGVKDPDDKAEDSAPLDQAAYEGDQVAGKGIFALKKTDLFNLLCIPPDTRDGDTAKAVYTTALKYCVDRRAMLIVDPPTKWKKAGDVTASSIADDLGLSGEMARNAAVFFPRVIQADPMRDGQLDTFVPCGIVAGVMARTDTRRGVWKAPAGIDAALNGAQGLALNLINEENGMVNPLGVNALRSFPAVGRVVWGARTARGADLLADEYKYIPVRRTALFIEESLYRGTQWVVFEPNDEPLWAQIRLNLGAFMHNLFRQGAFQGQSPRDAYFVKCDKETTTQTDINLGIVNIVVGFAPLKPAEFVVIKLQQIAGQIQA
ncbi:MAG: phage tail protein [Burkholderiales bacterium RIFCSPLOWO2_02_FULL_57_36]|nr:MAG: phage tail protein [Burkholderiales bacterium RIFCSPLOWO2_02_FULL_57_36]